MRNSFLCKTVSSSLLLKFSLALFLKCFLILAWSDSHVFNILFSYIMSSLKIEGKAKTAWLKSERSYIQMGVQIYYALHYIYKAFNYWHLWKHKWPLNLNHVSWMIELIRRIVSNIEHTKNFSWRFCWRCAFCFIALTSSFNFSSISDKKSNLTNNLIL